MPKDFYLDLRHTVWTQLITIFSSALCRGGMVLWSAKVPKALRQSSNEPFAQFHAHQKNSGTSFCVQHFFIKLNHRYEHKTTAFKVC